MWRYWRSVSGVLVAAAMASPVVSERVHSRAEVDWTNSRLVAVGYGAAQEGPTTPVGRVKQRMLHGESVFVVGRQTMALA